MSIATKLTRTVNPIYLPQYDPYKHLVVYDAGFHIGSGTELIDLSPHRSHGTISGASWATGVHRPCLDFNSATPDYVEIPASYDQLNFTSEKLSLVITAKFDNMANYHYLINRGEYNVDGYYCYINPSGYMAFSTNQSSANQETYGSNGDLSAGTRYTLGVSLDGASCSLYKNGADCVGTPGTHTNPATSSKAFLIGIYSDKSSNPIDGRIEFCRVWKDIALSASDHLWYHNRLQ